MEMNVIAESSGKLLKVITELHAPKDQKNGFGNYNYRSCEGILEAIKPLLKINNLCMNISDKVINIGEFNYVESTVNVWDIETGSIWESTAYAREAKTKKGMDDSQITGATSSYARKYALNGMFLIDDTKDADSQDNRPDNKTNQVKETFNAKPEFNRLHAIEEIEKAMGIMNYPPEEVAIVRDMVNGAKGKDDFASIYKTIMKGKKVMGKITKPLQKNKAHQRYRNADGKIVIGATTALGIMAKPALVKWANNLGLKGIDSSSYTDSMATIGTLAHYMVECYLTNHDMDLSEYSPAEISLAENSVLKFYEWEKQHDYELIFSEKQLISEQYQYGGCIDIYWKLDGVYTLTDIKTSKACYSEHKTQLASYKQLLEENGYPVDACNILRIGRDESEGFDFIQASDMDLHFDRFKHCLAIYDLNKKLR